MKTNKLLMTWGLAQGGRFPSASASAGGSGGGEAGEHIGFTISRHVDRFFDNPDYSRWKGIALHVYCHCLPVTVWPWQKPGVETSERLIALGIGMFIGYPACRVAEMAHDSLLEDFEGWYERNKIDSIVEMFEKDFSEAA